MVSEENPAALTEQRARSAIRPDSQVARGRLGARLREPHSDDPDGGVHNRITGIHTHTKESGGLPHVHSGLHGPGDRRVPRGERQLDLNPNRLPRLLDAGDTAPTELDHPAALAGSLPTAEMDEQF